MALANLLDECYIDYLIGLIKDLLIRLNIWMENTLVFLFIVHYQEVLHVLNCLIN